MVQTIGVSGAVYDAIEYGGPTVRALSISERMTLANMAIEMGGKVGLIEADEITDRYLAGRVRYDTGTGHLRPVNPHYRRVVELNVDDLGTARRLPAGGGQRAPRHGRRRHAAR